MSGDLQVRKRKGKAKKKEELILEAPASRNGSSSSSSGYTASAPTNSNTQTLVGPDDLTRPEKISVEEARDAGSGCLAKLLCVCLLSTLLVLTGLIYVHLHSGFSPQVIESPKRLDSPIKHSSVIEPNFEKERNEFESSTSKREREVDIESLESQIISGEVIQQLSKEKMVEEVVVDIPDTDAPAIEPVDEPPFVKESVTILGDQSKGQGNEIRRDSATPKEEKVDLDPKVEVVVEETKMEVVENDEPEVIQEPVKEVKENKKDLPNEDSLSNSIPPPQESESVLSTPTNAEEITTGEELKDKASSSESISTSDAKQEDSTDEEDAPGAASSGDKEGKKKEDATSSEKNTKPDTASSEDKKETKQSDAASGEDKEPKKSGGKKRRVRAPPSPEELLPHRNSIERSERLMEAILELSPGHPIVAELRPHLDGAKRDLAAHKLQGLEDTTKHVLLILEDVYVRLADEKEHGNGSTEPLVPADEFDTAAAPSQTPVEETETTSSPSTSDAPSSDSNEPVKTSPPVPAPAAAPPAADPPKTSPPVPSPSAAGEEAGNAPPKQTAGATKQRSAATADAKAKQKDSPVGSAQTSPGRAQETAPRELSASSSGDVKLENLTDEDLVSAVDTEDLTEQMRAAEQLRQQDPREALRVFTAAVREQPLSPRAALGRARCLDLLAEKERSNERLDQAIASYRSIITLSEDRPELVSHRLLRAVGDTLVDKLRFRGHVSACVRVQQRLLRQFPEDVSLRNQLGISFLLQGQPKAAEQVFRTVLDTWPDNGLAQVHLGFILKTIHNNNSEGARLMRAGLSSKDEGTRDARFYFHLGDAFNRLGRVQDARQVYEEGAAEGLFLSASQRSLYNVNRLTARPVWTPEQTTYQDFLHILQQNWRTIRAEGLALLEAPASEGFVPEAENLRASGYWGQLELISRGKKHPVNCVRAPITCAIIANYPPAASCKRGQVKFSVLEGGTHVWAHCGPTNCRLRAHLGLVVPQENPVPVLRVDDKVLRWGEGELFVFDDSFEHEVWHNGTQRRLVLIVDLWHPDLTDKERATLAPV